jgi:ribosomal protein S18 acetylase RimI-like enzyme
LLSAKRWKSIAQLRLKPSRSVFAMRLKRICSAFEGAQLVGMATFLRETGVKERHKGRIYGVYVSTGHSGKGVGRALLVELLERAKRDSSLEQILLAVGSDRNAAKQLYMSLGFEAFGTEPRALKVGAKYVHEDHMILRLL